MSNYTYFREWVEQDDFPCLMAKSVFMKDLVTLKDYDKISPESLSKLSDDLQVYLNEYNKLERNEFASFIATFESENPQTEIEFEKRLFELLSMLTEIDDKEWDPTVSDNPTSNNFSYSHHGQSFYIIGMHPNSSRKARRSKVFSVVFNLHNQFERLREMGVYVNVRDKIRARDKAYSGSVNPMVKDYGTSSEAKQYSGRHIQDENWVCPFSNRNKN